MTGVNITKFNNKRQTAARKQSKGVTLNRIDHGRCEDLIPLLPDNSINAVIMSPPYAEQRKKFYLGKSEEEYPEWMAGIMTALKPKMAKDGNVLINIRPHVRKWELSDFVLRTRLAIREAGWIEADEFIWYAVDKPPVGSRNRLRRSWEHVLWFTPNRGSYCDPRGAQTRTEWNKGGRRAKDMLKSHKGVFKDNRHLRIGKPPRCSDVIQVAVGGVAKGIDHTAMFPEALPEFLIKTFSRPNDLVIDPFLGSGTTALVAESLGRRWWGCDAKAEYVELARSRMAEQQSKRMAG